jgi:Plavaka transposase
LAAYVADYPEQSLVTSTLKGRCPKCLQDLKRLGELLECPLHDAKHTRGILKYKGKGYPVREFKSKGLRQIYSPFWAELPHCDIFEAITPDILHQLHKGVFHDHLVSWLSAIADTDDIDERFKSMTSHPGLRHFQKGISK